MTTLLISDLHLEEERPDITRAFLLFLQERARKAEALYILGDLFESWIGDDAMSRFHHSIAKALHELAEHGTHIFLMHGNRDFLIGKRFCDEAGCRLLVDASVVELGGERVLLTHGDRLCTGDEAYMRLRRWLRNPLSLWILHHLPLTTRRRLARQLRKESRVHTLRKPVEITDVTPEEVPPLMARHGVQMMVHGHTHRPAVHEFQLNGRQARRIVLGDWDSQAWVLQVDRQGFRLEPVAI